MKIIIEVANDEELKKIAEILKGQHITFLKTVKDRKKILEDIFSRYNVPLPDDYRFNRREIHAR